MGDAHQRQNQTQNQTQNQMHHQNRGRIRGKGRGRGEQARPDLEYSKAYRRLQENKKALTLLDCSSLYQVCDINILHDFMLYDACLLIYRIAQKLEVKGF